MKKGSKVAMIVVLLLVVVFGVGQFFAFSPVTSTQNQPASDSATNTALTTQVITYTPSITSSTPVQEGSCWTSSIAAPYRADAWRCAVGNGVSDPCFSLPQASSSGSQSVLCGVRPQNAAATSTFILRLTKSLPAPQVLHVQPSSSWAWLVELQDGTICSPFTGTLPFASDGESAGYGCAPGPLGKDVMIFGDLDTSGSPWTAKIGTLSVSTSTFPPALESSRTIGVKAVWQ